MSILENIHPYKVHELFLVYSKTWKIDYLKDCPTYLAKNIFSRSSEIPIQLDWTLSNLEFCVYLFLVGQKFA